MQKVCYGRDNRDRHFKIEEKHIFVCNESNIEFAIQGKNSNIESLGKVCSDPEK